MFGSWWGAGGNSIEVSESSSYSDLSDLNDSDLNDLDEAEELNQSSSAPSDAFGSTEVFKGARFASRDATRKALEGVQLLHHRNFRFHKSKTKGARTVWRCDRFLETK